MTMLRHPKGHPKAGQFLTRKEMNELPVASYTPIKISPAEIEEALARMAPTVTVKAPPIPEFRKKPHFFIEEAPVEEQKHEWAWPRTNFVLDIIGAAFSATFLGLYGIVAFLIARHGIIKFIAWISSL